MARGDGARASEKAATALDRFAQRLQQGTRALQGRSNAERGFAAQIRGVRGAGAAVGTAASATAADIRLLTDAITLGVAAAGELSESAKVLLGPIAELSDVIRSGVDAASILSGTQGGIAAQLAPLARAGVPISDDLVRNVADVEAAQQIDVFMLQRQSRRVGAAALGGEASRRGFDSFEDFIAQTTGGE